MIHQQWDNTAVHDPDSTDHRNPMDLRDHGGDRPRCVLCLRLPSVQKPGHFQQSRQFRRFSPGRRSRSLHRNYMPGVQDGCE